MTLASKSSNVINVLKCVLCVGVVFVHGQMNLGSAHLLCGVKWGGEKVTNTLICFKEFLRITFAIMSVYRYFSYYQASYSS